MAASDHLSEPQFSGLKWEGTRKLSSAQGPTGTQWEIQSHPYDEFDARHRTYFLSRDRVHHGQYDRPAEARAAADHAERSQHEPEFGA
jgi:hypothetical protein